MLDAFSARSEEDFSIFNRKSSTAVQVWTAKRHEDCFNQTLRRFHNCTILPLNVYVPSGFRFRENWNYAGDVQIQKHFDFMIPRQSETHRMCVRSLWSVKDLEQKLIIKAVSGSCALRALSIYFPIGNSKNTLGERNLIDVFEVMSRRRPRCAMCVVSVEIGK